MESFPRKRLMIGRLLANLSLTSISRTSVGRETKLNCCNKRRVKNMKLVAEQQHAAARDQPVGFDGFLKGQKQVLEPKA